MPSQYHPHAWVFRRSGRLYSMSMTTRVGARGQAFSRLEEVVPARPTVSWVNLVEVYYPVERDHGRAPADETVRELRTALAADLPGTARMIEAARLKARTAIGLADCFAVATAAAHGL